MVFPLLYVSSSYPFPTLYPGFVCSNSCVSLQAADYFESHFDNGEDYGFDDDDNLDEGAMDF